MPHESCPSRPWLILDVRQKLVSTVLKEQFEAKAKQEGFSVAFSRQVARVLDYRDAETHIEFTLDASERGSDWITLEHHPESMPRGARYLLAFSRSQQFLQACGFQVEVYGDSEKKA
jgi:hypothetical protein